MPKDDPLHYAIIIVLSFYAFLIGMGIYLQMHRTASDLPPEKSPATIGH